MRTIGAVFLLVCMATMTSCTQVPDSSRDTAYSREKGTTVYIDEGHHNYHTMDGGYRPFADVLRKDGYVVKRFDSEFSPDTLSEIDILVISNALNQKNVRNWTLPCPSAFTKSEIKSLVDWVEQGGSLFLVADHMPFGGAASDLAKAFGFKFSNAFAMKKYSRGPSLFSVRNNTLVESVVTRGRSVQERITEVETYTGQAFMVPKGTHPILIFNDDHVNLYPAKAWQFTKTTQSHEIKGWCQGAFIEFGQGRLVVFGEAAVFRKQTSDQSNFKLLLNLIHWLDGLLSEETM